MSLCESNRWCNRSWVHIVQWLSVFVTKTGALLSCEQVCLSAFLNVSSALALHLDNPSATGSVLHCP